MSVLHIISAYITAAKISNPLMNWTPVDAAVFYNLTDSYHEYLLGNCHDVNVTELIDDKTTLGQVMARCPQSATIAWANIDTDPCHNMVAQSHNELLALFLLENTLYLHSLILG